MVSKLTNLYYKFSEFCSIFFEDKFIPNILLKVHMLMGMRREVTNCKFQL